MHIGIGRMAALFILVAGLGACASNPRMRFAEPIPEAAVRSIFVASTQTSEHNGRKFGTRRNGRMKYSVVDVSVPPSHRPGRIEWPGHRVDPKHHFAVTRDEAFADAAEFRDKIAAAPANGSEVTVLYVHGYNQTLLKSSFRLAQIMTDYDEDGPAVVFGWPSAGNPRAYLYDRDSILFARDDLVEVLRDLTAKSDRNVAIVAHSMGAQLTMEALRQIALREDRELLSRVTWVTLVSPDIDPDVFRRQAEAIGDLPEEFYIMVARQDHALRLSSFLTGGRRRMGLIDGPEDVAGLDVTVFDLSDLADGRRGDHGVGFNSALAIAAVSSLEDIDAPSDDSPEFLVFGPRAIKCRQHQGANLDCPTAANP